MARNYLVFDNYRVPESQMSVRSRLWAKRRAKARATIHRTRYRRYESIDITSIGDASPKRMRIWDGGELISWGGA